MSFSRLPPAYEADALAAMDGFRDALALSASELLETHLALPREVRYVADLQRWLISQVTIAMHFEHGLDPAAPPISPVNLVRALEETGIASRNTIQAFLMEMRRYHFVVPLPSADRRQRNFKATEMSEQLIRRYFDIHLRALDAVDGGARYALSCARPRLLWHAQPRFARLLCNRPDWHRPPPGIGRFVRSDSGSSVLHELAMNVAAPGSMVTDRIWVGKVSPHIFSQRYRISRAHVSRLFAAARSEGLIGWARQSNRGDCWISPELVRAYRLWQAVKLAAVSRAFHEACLCTGDAGSDE